MAAKKTGRGRMRGDYGFDRAKLEETAPRAVLENAVELVDHEAMIKRLREGNEISCTFVSLEGQIHTSVTASKYAFKELCTCEAPYFCRHAAALVLTFLDRPDSFLDLEAFLDDIGKMEPRELVKIVRRMVGRYPGSALEVLGVEGFQSADVLDDPAEDDHLFFDDDGLDLFGGGGDWDDLDDLPFDDVDDDDDDDDDRGSNGPPKLN